MQSTLRSRGTPGPGGALVPGEQPDTAQNDLALARWLAWVVVGVGTLVLIGWIADQPILRSLLPRQVETKANTAVCLILAGVALGLKCGPAGRARISLANLCAALATLTGLLTLGEYVIGRNLGIDELLFRDSTTAAYTVNPGRMAMPTAFILCLLGTALLLLETGRGRAVAWLVAPAATLAGLAFFGQLYDLPFLASFGPFTPIATPTGVTFLILCLGMLLAGSDLVVARVRRSSRTIGFIFALLLLLLMAGAVLHNTQVLIHNSRRVTHTYEVLDRLVRSLSAIQELETGARGYVLTGDPRFLDTSNPASSAVDRLLLELHELTADNPIQQARLDRLRILLDRKNSGVRQQVGLRRQGDTAAAQAIVASGAGKLLMDEIRRLVGELQHEERQLLQERQGLLEASTLRTLLTLGTGLVVSVGLLVTIFVLLRREIAARRQFEAALSHSEENLAVTLNSIGDAVLATDTTGRVTRMNRVAEELTGWARAEARGRPVAEVFRIINEETRTPATIPVDEVLSTGEIREPANHTALIARDGTERAIADSAAPIRNPDGRLIGVVLVFRDVTESRRAQAELDRFFSLSLDFLCIASADGTFKRASPGITDILGWTVEEFLSKPYLDQVHPDDRAATQREVDRQMVFGEKVLRFENRYRHKDGSWRVLSWRSSPQGRLMYATARDVTESRQAKEDLERRVRERTAELAQANETLLNSERRFRALLEHGSDSIALIDENNRIIYLSPAVTAMEGYTPEELLGRSGVEHTHPDDLPLVQEIVRQLVAQPGRPIPVLWRRRHKNGQWLWLEGVATNLLHDPAVRAIVTNYRDVTGRKHTEQVLRESEEHFRFLNDLAVATRTLADPGQIMAVMARMLGQHLHASRCAYADVELDSERFTILHDYTDGCASTVGDYHLSLFGARAVATLLHGQTLIIRNVAAELLPDDGADMFEAIGIQAIITCPLVKDGRLRAMMAVHQVAPRDWQANEIAIVQDVVERCWATIERQTAEKKVARLNVELEHRVIERTAQLESANRELEAFSYSVSHDLRAPLRHVQGYVELLTREAHASLGEKSRRYLQTITDAAREMGELIDDLLAFSHMGRSEMREGSVDLATLAEDTRQRLAFAATGRDIRWRIASLPAVQGDPAMLRQVLVNLLGNALKYTRQRDPAEIEIGVAGTEEDRIVLFVRDNGAGFDMKYADKLFGVFQRLHRTDEFEGTGIGLASVRRILTRHGGRVWADARVNAGATFYFTLLPAPAGQPATPAPI